MCVLVAKHREVPTTEMHGETHQQLRNCYEHRTFILKVSNKFRY
jgi:hypothetical protein